MIASGAIRRIDDLGRITIPKEVRKQAFGTSDVCGKPMEVFYESDGIIILKPYEFDNEDKYIQDFKGGLRYADRCGKKTECK